MNTPPPMTRVGVVLLWAALAGFALTVACGATFALADWLVTHVFPWLAADPQRQAGALVGLLALVALVAVRLENGE